MHASSNMCKRLEQLTALALSLPRAHYASIYVCEVSGDRMCCLSDDRSVLDG